MCMYKHTEDGGGQPPTLLVCVLRQGPSLGTGALQFGSADQRASFRWLPLSAHVYKGITSVLLHTQLFIGMLLIELGSVVSLSLSR